MSLGRLLVVIIPLFITSGLGSATAPSVPSTVTAGTAATATIANGDYFGTGDTNAIRAIEVFLATGNETVVDNSPNATKPQCWLTQSLPVCGVAGITIYQDHVSFSNYTFSFTIPTKVGQKGKHVLKSQILMADGSVYGDVLPSNAFNLTGETGRAQLFDTVIAPAAYVPCASYDCVNNCLLSMWGSSNPNATSAECANKCAGVSVPPNWLDPTAPPRPTTTIAGTGCAQSGSATSKPNTAGRLGAQSLWMAGASCLWTGLLILGSL